MGYYYGFDPTYILVIIGAVGIDILKNRKKQ